ncbi:MAG: glycosyltransferase [Candidatus Sedimenticola sp. PURPLELP]
MIDWHMQANGQSQSVVEMINECERVFVGANRNTTGLYAKIMNHLSGLRHDLGLYGLVKKNNYDFIQIRDKTFAALIGLIAAKRKGIPFYYWMSFPYPEADIFRSRDKLIHINFLLRLFYALRGYLTDWFLYSIVLPNSDFVFVQSDQMQRDVTERGISLNRTMPVPMCIDVHGLENTSLPVISDERLADRIPIVYMGTMVKVRKIDFLLKMLAEIKKIIPEVILILVGDAPEDDMKWLKGIANNLGLESDVIFTGFVPMETAWGYVNKASLCLSPFRPSFILNSTTPTKVVEYLALGCPVVANKHPDQSKVLSESGAGLAVEYSPQAFSDAVQLILTDEKLANSMRKAGPLYVKNNRDYAIMSRLLEDKYLKMLETFSKK